MNNARNSRVAILLMATTALMSACGGRDAKDSVADARSRLDKGDLNGAVIELKSQLQRDPNAGQARLLLGRALLLQGNPFDAQVELAKALDSGVDEDAAVPLLAKAWLAAGKSKDLIERYRAKTLSKPEAQAELQTSLAYAYAVMGKTAESAAALEAALKVEPPVAAAQLAKARFVASEGKFQEALQWADRSVRAGEPQGEVQLLKGIVLQHGLKDGPGAIKSYEQAASDPQAEVRARAALVSIYLRDNNLPAAKAQVAELTKTHKRHVQTLYADAMVSYIDKKYERTETIANELLRAIPDSPKLLVLAGAASLQRGALLEAESKLGKVVQTVENAGPARKLLAETYLRMGHPDKVLAVLRPVLESGRADGETLALAGNAYVFQGNLKAAEEHLSAAAKERPDDVQVQTSLALAELAKGNAATALGALQSIAAKDPGETADMALIGALLRRNEIEQALAAIDKLAAKQAGRPGPLHLRGIALRRKGDWAGARQAYESALKADPRYFAAVSELVALDLYEQRAPDAKARLDAIIKEDRKNVSARLLLANVLLRMGAKPAERLAVIDDAISVAPADPTARIARIVHLSTHGDPKGAAAAAQDALAQAPQNPELLDAAGRAFALAQEHQQAVTAFNKLASVRPGSPTPHLRLADIALSRGELGAAASALNRAFDVAPASPEVRERLLDFARSRRDPKPAQLAAKELQRRYPQSASGLMLEGELAIIRKDWAAALAAFKLASTKNDAGTRPQTRTFDVLVASQGVAGAEAYAAEWLKAHPKDLAFLQHLGTAALERKDLGAAERRFKELLAVAPEHPAALNNLAWLMAARKDKDAVKMAERALAASPNAATVLDTLAKALASAGDAKKAIDVQRKAVAMVPEAPHYRIQLVELLLQAGDKAEATRQLDQIQVLGQAAAPYGAHLDALRKAARAG